MVPSVNNEVDSFAHARDAVVLLSDPISSLKVKVANIVDPNARTKKVTPTIVAGEDEFFGGAHGTQGYVIDYPGFIIAEHRNGSGIDGASLSQSLVSSIREGRLANWVHDEIIRRRLDAGDQGFARSLHAAAHAGKLGNFSIRDFLDRIAEVGDFNLGLQYA